MAAKKVSQDAIDSWFRKLVTNAHAGVRGAKSSASKNFKGAVLTRAHQLVQEHAADSLSFKHKYLTAADAFATGITPSPEVRKPLVKVAKVHEPVGTLPTAQLSLFGDELDMHINRHQVLMQALAHGTQAMVHLKQLDPMAVDRSYVEQTLSYLSMGLMVHDRLVGEAIRQMPAPVGRPPLPPANMVAPLELEPVYAEDEELDPIDVEAAELSVPGRGWAVAKN